MNYDSIVNYNTAYNEVAYKLFFKIFYNRINKKQYNLKFGIIIYHINIIVIKNVIFLEKISEKKELLMGILDITELLEMVQVSSPINLAEKCI